MFETHVTVVGNLVADPRFQTLDGGSAVASFRLASTPRHFDRAAGEWRDRDTLYVNVTCWRGLAENVAVSLKKGHSVIVRGRLSVRPYETKEGEKRQSVDIDAIAVGPELSRVTTIVKRVERSTSGSAAGSQPSDASFDPAVVDSEFADDFGGVLDEIEPDDGAAAAADPGDGEAGAGEAGAEEPGAGEPGAGDGRDGELVGSGGGRLKARFGIG